MGVVSAPRASAGLVWIKTPHSAFHSLRFSVGDESVTRNSLTSKPMPPAPTTATVLPTGLPRIASA
jgi:hypothetical protein